MTAPFDPRPAGEPACNVCEVLAERTAIEARLRTAAEALRELLQDHQHRKHDCGGEWCPVADARAVLAALEKEGLA